MILEGVAIAKRLKTQIRLMSTTTKTSNPIECDQSYQSDRFHSGRESVRHSRRRGSALNSHTIDPTFVYKSQSSIRVQAVVGLTETNQTYQTKSASYNYGPPPLHPYNCPVLTRFLLSGFISIG
jgi:hypothetical protein